MLDICCWGAGLGSIDGPRGHGPPSPPPPTPVPSPWSPGGAIRKGVYRRGVLEGVGLWSLSVNNFPRPFYMVVVCVNGREGKIGGTSVLVG